MRCWRSGARQSLVIFAACWAISYRPIMVVGPTISPVLIGIHAKQWPRHKGMRLHVFNTGVNRVSPLLVGSPSPWRAVPAFVIEHPDKGLLVFDCGLEQAIVQRGEAALPWAVRLLFQSRSAPGRLLDQQMKAAGLSPDNVKMVVLSHLHFDHIGRAAAFPNATFVVGEGARHHDRSVHMGFSPALLRHIPERRWRELKLSAARPFATFDTVTDLFGDQSVMVVHGGGHAHNDLGLLLMLPQGPVLLAGDMVVHHPWLRQDDVQRIAATPLRAARVRNQIRALLQSAPQTLLIPGHDLTGLPQHRKDLTLHHPLWFLPNAWYTGPLPVR